MKLSVTCCLPGAAVGAAAAAVVGAAAAGAVVGAAVAAPAAGAVVGAPAAGAGEPPHAASSGSAARVAAPIAAALSARLRDHGRGALGELFMATSLSCACRPFVRAPNWRHCSTGVEG